MLKPIRKSRGPFRDSGCFRRWRVSLGTIVYSLDERKNDGETLGDPKRFRVTQGDSKIWFLPSANCMLGNQLSQRLFKHMIRALMVSLGSWWRSIGL